MGTFKVGQWVRVVDNAGAPCSYTIGEICQVEHVGFTITCVGRTAGMYDYRFEPWTPRVGDRVRMTKRVDGQKANCGATIVHNDGSKRQPFVLDLDEPQTWAHRGSGYAKEDCGWWVALDDIEPLPFAAEVQPAADDRPDAGGGFKAGDKIRLVKSAIEGSRTIGNIYEAVARNGVSAETSVNFKDDAGTLTWAPGQYFELYQPLQIEAGKFYKTRDGRKVGPMKVNKWGFSGDIAGGPTGKVFQPDGRHGNTYVANVPTDDLISEWIEPASYDNAPIDEQPAAKPKFKVGDRVTASWGGANGPGTVVDYFKPNEDDTMSHRVRFDSGKTFWVYDEDIAALGEQPTAIVVLIENGQPKPAVRPYVHASAELAAKEADRLANKFKGKQFGVYVLSSTSEQAKPTYDYKWQRLAADGLKIDAIKELRGLTGMGLKPAKDAVEYFLAAA